MYDFEQATVMAAMMLAYKTLPKKPLTQNQIKRQKLDREISAWNDAVEAKKAVKKAKKAHDE